MVSAESEQLEINHADSLEILDDRLVLDGNVSVSTAGAERYTVLTKKLIAYKDGSGEYNRVECFERSEIVSKDYSLKADKVFFNKNPQTQNFSLVDATGNVDIKSFDGKRKIQAPKALIDTDQKMLFAKGGVKSQEFDPKNEKSKKITIVSEEQDISLQNGPVDSEPNSKKSSTKTSPKILAADKLSKQMEARGQVVTTLEAEADVKSEKAEFFTLNGKNEKAVFSGNAYFVKPDGTRGEGKVINYFPNSEDLQILAFDDKPAQITKTDGTAISGEQVNYNTFSKTTLVQKLSSTGFRSFLAVPYSDSNPSLEASDKPIAKSTMNVWADFIENKVQNENESTLTAHQNTDEELVEVQYGAKRGWGRNLFVFQNKAVPEKKADFLILAEKARMVDVLNKQVLEAPVIRIGLGTKDLSAGFTSRARGSLPLKKKSSTENTSQKSQSKRVQKVISKAKTTSETSKY
ncbi:MAG: hypothetical protein SFU25_08500 [Candidatus Caenarcaniphilales bacterium]|nr:hypothetical protein [Candidatus Caenarcaniphilales bacterium]